MIYVSKQSIDVPDTMGEIIRILQSGKQIRNINCAILHCIDDMWPGDKMLDPATLNEWHSDRGFSRHEHYRKIYNPQITSAGYHFQIHPDGSMDTIRHPNEVGAHCKAARKNYDSIGCLIDGSGKFTREAWNTINIFCFVCIDLGLRIYGHRQFDSTKTCPNFSVTDYLDRGLIPKRGWIL